MSGKSKTARLADRVQRWCDTHELSRIELAATVGVSVYSIYAVCYGRFWGATGDKLWRYLERFER